MAKKMITKGFWWKLLVIVAGYLALMLSIFSFAMHKTNTKTASADTVATSPYCLTNGKTTVDGETTWGCPDDKFKVYMKSARSSGSASISNGYLTNWSQYYIIVESIDVTEHLLLELYRNGSLYNYAGLPKDEDIVANFGSLPSGTYTLVYECRYKKNLFSSNVYYRYEYTFEVDIDKPTYTLSNGTGTGSYSYFTNKGITYSASDANFNYIRYQQGTSGNYKYAYGNSVTISATAANNGFWFFQAFDALGNSTAIVNRYIDTIAPTGTVEDQERDIVENGGATNRPFVYSATDAGAVARMEYKSPTVTSWTTYTGDAAVVKSDGWYYFRAVDGAGNVSDEYRVYYDTTRPTGCVYDAGGARGSGSITNKSYVKYTASDSGSGVGSVYVKKPGSSSFVSYTNGSQLTEQGKYYFKAYDKAGNLTSTTHEITLDMTAPVGQLKANGVNVVNGSYTSKSFSYSATDSIGVAIHQMKRPNSTSWETYTAGTAITGTEGWYYFRATDLAGNVSAESKIFYDVSKPTVTLIGSDGTALTSGAVVGGEYIKATAIDGGSGIATFRVWGDNYSSAVSYVNGTELTKEGRYYFDATNKAGLSSETYRIVFDKTAPNGVLYADGIKVASGTITNAEKIMYSASDSLAGLQECFVKKPNTSGFVAYTSGVELTEEGTYEFYSVDYAGNQSAISTITVNRSIPTAQLYVDGEPVINGGYTNGQYVKFESNGTCFVKKPNTSEFIPYVSGTEFYEAGRYEFFAISESLTSTKNHVVIVDRTPKTVNVTRPGKLGSWRDYAFSWVNGNLDTTAPITRITINGYDYEFGSTIYTLEGQEYNVVVYDAAGNEWTTTLKAGSFDIPTYTVQKVFWEVDIPMFGETFSFEKYENALLTAIDIENLLYETKTWNTETWDQGIPMDTKDSVNAVNGTYYVYKSEDDATKLVAYFTQERLNEVVKQYAEERIVAYYYWQKDPAEGVDLTVHAYRDQFKIVATEVHLREGLIYTLDGVPYTRLEITAPGAHTLLLEDGYGGSIEYEIYILDKAQGMEYALGENSPSKAEFGRTYHFNGKVTLSVPFEGDDFAMFVVYDKDGEVVGYYDIETPCVIDKSDSYTAVAYNHFGESEVFSFVVSMNAPKISAVNSEEKKQLDVLIAESVDKESNITFLEISKSTDGGETWEILTKDDYGKAISIDDSQYKFRTSGIYKVVVMDEFRTGIDAVAYTVEYTQAEPVGVLVGVTNGAITNKAVTFTWADEALVTLTKDGMEIGYISGQKLVEDGVYVLTFSNYDGYKKVYTFEIDTHAPDLVIEGASNREAVNEDVKVYYTEENLTAELYKDGKMLGYYVSGNPISADGQYRVRVYDLAGNEVSVEFSIDKTVSYTINVYDKGLSNSVVVTSHEILTTELTKNGEKVDYALGTAIVEPADYTLVLTDALGNKDVITFRIIEPLVQAFTHNFDDIEGMGGVLVNGEEKRLNYGTLELLEDGSYEVGVIVGGKVYQFAVTVDKTRPIITLEGVEDGGVTNGTVCVADVNESVLGTVYLNGEKTAFVIGDKLTEEGEYKVVAVDLAGNTAEVSFTIDKTAPTIILNGVENGGSVKGSVSITDISETATLKVTKDGEELAYNLGDELKEAGMYEIILTDVSGNVSEYTFEITKGMSGWAIAGIVVGSVTLLGGVVLFILKKRGVI